MTTRLRFAALPLALAVAACTQAAPPAADTAAAAPSATAAAQAVRADEAAPVATPTPADRSPVATTLPRVVVHKSPTCGCCSLWVQHMQHAGFAVDVVETDDLESVRRHVGVPVGKASCHTAQVDGYFVEGHVPADDVKRLLAERPAARGLTAPGMPAGSPGMEVPSGATPGYSVLLVATDGTTREFARHGSD
jgi:hypothetical protein